MATKVYNTAMIFTYTPVRVVSFGSTFKNDCVRAVSGPGWWFHTMSDAILALVFWNGSA